MNIFFSLKTTTLMAWVQTQVLNAFALTLKKDCEDLESLGVLHFQRAVLIHLKHDLSGNKAYRHRYLGTLLAVTKDQWDQLEKDKNKFKDETLKETYPLACPDLLKEGCLSQGVHTWLKVDEIETFGVGQTPDYTVKYAKSVCGETEAKQAQTNAEAEQGETIETSYTTGGTDQMGGTSQISGVEDSISSRQQSAKSVATVKQNPIPTTCSGWENRLDRIMYLFVKTQRNGNFDWWKAETTDYDDFWKFTPGQETEWIPPNERFEWTPSFTCRQMRLSNCPWPADSKVRLVEGKLCKMSKSN